ncbi:MAG TPA: hypothetical protein PKD70_13315 [Saprospiraceae bacterium]|nr:hypothetical protein [Saprospiraceae bacterium]HMP14852.1 hypothetical protein [Saprospiraceae bacterium]
MMDNMKEEFYIGWQDKAPMLYAQKTRQLLWMVLLLVIGVSALLVLNQKPFSASTFEITKLRTLEGILIKSPIPCLKVPIGIDHKGIQQFQRVLLIGFGKKSAIPTLDAIEKAQKQILDGKPVKLEGKLIYFDGTLAMELTEGLNTFKGVSDIKDTPSIQQALGMVTLRGEILDPKCYLGVMRPGEGKPHRSCAIRCILGGIPPFFKAATKDDNRQYFFILDANGHTWHQEIAHYVADEVQLCGMVEKWDDWYVIKITNSADIQRIKWHWAKHIPMCATN